MKKSHDHLGTPYKAYVAVNEDRLEDGTIIPRVITWEDGKRYEIVKASKSCKAASTKASGAGLRFTILVECASETTFLWLESRFRGAA